MGAEQRLAPTTREERSTLQGQDLWVEVMDSVTPAEVIEAAREQGTTIQEIVSEAVTEWSKVFEIPAGHTTESITAALVQEVAASTHPS